MRRKGVAKVTQTRRTSPRTVQSTGKHLKNDCFTTELNQSALKLRRIDPVFAFFPSLALLIALQKSSFSTGTIHAPGRGLVPKVHMEQSVPLWIIKRIRIRTGREKK